MDKTHVEQLSEWLSEMLEDRGWSQSELARRAFALTCLRNGMDVFTLQRLMGHSSLTILRRYLHQTEGDLEGAHAVHGPVDHL